MILLFLQCGPNAECRHEVFRGAEEAETICVCADGYTGDPDSKEGCSHHKTNAGDPDLVAGVELSLVKQQG